LFPKFDETEQLRIIEISNCSHFSWIPHYYSVACYFHSFDPIWIWWLRNNKQAQLQLCTLYNCIYIKYS